MKSPPGGVLVRIEPATPVQLATPREYRPPHMRSLGSGQIASVAGPTVRGRTGIVVDQGERAEPTAKRVGEPPGYPGCLHGLGVMLMFTSWIVIHGYVCHTE
jgi:hypothetical protein